MAVKFEDNSRLVLSELHSSAIRGLDRCGRQGAGYAQDGCPVDTGELRESITYLVVPQELAVYIGTTSEHGPYVELGTGRYYPGGRKDPWSYQDAHGNWHKTVGNKPQPYIKPAVVDHIGTFNSILEDEIRGGSIL